MAEEQKKIPGPASRQDFGNCPLGAPLTAFSAKCQITGCGTFIHTTLSRASRHNCPRPGGCARKCTRCDAMVCTSHIVGFLAQICTDCHHLATARESAARARREERARTDRLAADALGLCSAGVHHNTVSHRCPFRDCREWIHSYLTRHGQGRSICAPLGSGRTGCSLKCIVCDRVVCRQHINVDELTCDDCQVPVRAAERLRSVNVRTGLNSWEHHYVREPARYFFGDEKKAPAAAAPPPPAGWQASREERVPAAAAAAGSPLDMSALRTALPVDGLPPRGLPGTPERAVFARAVAERATHDADSPAHMDIALLRAALAALDPNGEQLSLLIAIQIRAEYLIYRLSGGRPPTKDEPLQRHLEMLMSTTGASHGASADIVEQIVRATMAKDEALLNVHLQTLVRELRKVLIQIATEAVHPNHANIAVLERAEADDLIARFGVEAGRATFSRMQQARRARLVSRRGRIEIKGAAAVSSLGGAPPPTHNPLPPARVAALMAQQLSAPPVVFAADAVRWTPTPVSSYAPSWYTNQGEEPPAWHPGEEEGEAATRQRVEAEGGGGSTDVTMSD